MAIYRRGTILKFVQVCNNFVKAQIAVDGLGTVWALVAKDHKTGEPVLSKGEVVAHFDAKQRTYKGHIVQGVVLALELADDNTDWGLK
jgi:hypothetical protein